MTEKKSKISIEAVFTEQDSNAPAQNLKLGIDLSMEKVREIRRFHGSMEGYCPTPLHSLPGLAKVLGIKQIYVKDESFRFGLNAFKSLGATWALTRILCRHLNIDPAGKDFSFFVTPGIKEKIKDLVFITATDGNHGRGLAWAARQLGCRAHIYMPRGSVKIRVENIEKQGAEVWVTDVNYDDTVRLADKAAKENGWCMVQDTAWEGYEEVPAWILQGYTTMADEVLEQIKDQNMDLPTHMFLQAGVGSMAAAVLGYYANVLDKDCPACFIVEPDRADCMYQSAKAGDGRPIAVSGDLDTMMAGLACGEPNPFAWEILNAFSTGFISCADAVAGHGMEILAHARPGDPAIVSGESGAVGPGLVSILMTDPAHGSIKEKMGLTRESVLLCFSTEGDTDPENYLKIVGKG